MLCKLCVLCLFVSLLKCANIVDAIHIFSELIALIVLDIDVFFTLNIHWS